MGDFFFWALIAWDPTEGCQEISERKGGGGGGGGGGALTGLEPEVVQLQG